VQIRNQFIASHDFSVPEKKGFRNPGLKWEGKLENDHVQLTIAICTGRGNFDYKVFGKRLE